MKILKLSLASTLLISTLFSTTLAFASRNNNRCAVDITTYPTVRWGLDMDQSIVWELGYEFTKYASSPAPPSSECHAEILNVNTYMPDGVYEEEDWHYPESCVIEYWIHVRYPGQPGKDIVINSEGATARYFSFRRFSDNFVSWEATGPNKTERSDNKWTFEFKEDRLINLRLNGKSLCIVETYQKKKPRIDK